MSLYDDVDREALHDWLDELPGLRADAMPDRSEYEDDDRRTASGMTLEEMCVELGRAKAERDHFRRALEWITDHSRLEFARETYGYAAYSQALEAINDRARHAVSSAASGDPVARETTPPTAASEQGQVSE